MANDIVIQGAVSQVDAVRASAHLMREDPLRFHDCIKTPISAGVSGRPPHFKN